MHVINRSNLILHPKNPGNLREKAKPKVCMVAHIKNVALHVLCEQRSRRSCHVFLHVTGTTRDWLFCVGHTEHVYSVECSIKAVWLKLPIH